MNFDGDFILIGKLDSAALRECILEFTEEDWNRNDVRQKSFAAHRDTTTIPLIFDEDFRHTQPTILPEFELLEPLLEPVYQLIRRGNPPIFSIS